MASLKQLLFYLSLWIGHAVAGSGFWQPSLRDKPVLDKRYLHVKPESPDRFWANTVWPDKKIRVCYENQATRERFHLDLMAAHQTWVTAGLGSDFKIEVAPEADCADERKLKDLLLIKAGMGLRTTVGFLAENSPRRTSYSADGVNYGPEMTLTDDERIGMLRRIPNYAHELGHAMGLYHEHQNPNFWSGSGIETAEGGSVFGPDNNGNWRCENLKDYALHKKPFVVQNPRGQQNYRLPDKCKDWSYALQDGFSAADYLPMPEHIALSAPGKDGKDVDWKSIMICKSLSSLWPSYKMKERYKIMENADDVYVFFRSVRCRSHRRWRRSRRSTDADFA